ncbi:hypothetical protein CLOP_g11114 [Closterium sp. NIES-67]|nr:hypothetical protein CLOP_g11114 [Closterium sp. NIES-67]
MPSLLADLARLGPLRIHLVDGAAVAEVTASQAALLEAAAFGREMGDWGGGPARMSDEPCVVDRDLRAAGKAELRGEAEGAAASRTQEDAAARLAKKHRSFPPTAVVAAAGGAALLASLQCKGQSLRCLSGFRASAAGATPGGTAVTGATNAVAIVAAAAAALAGVASVMLPRLRRVWQRGIEEVTRGCDDSSSISTSSSSELPTCIVLLSLEELMFLSARVKCVVYVDRDACMETVCEGGEARDAGQQHMKRSKEPTAAASILELESQQTSDNDDTSSRDNTRRDGRRDDSSGSDISRRDTDEQHRPTAAATWEVKEQEVVQYGEAWRRGFGAMAAVYGQLRGRNWVVRPGLQFGSHFTAYQHHPALVHSKLYSLFPSTPLLRCAVYCCDAFFFVLNSFMVLVNGSGVSNPVATWNDLHATVRLASTVAKKLLIAYVEEEGEGGENHVAPQTDMLGAGITEAGIGQVGGNEQSRRSRQSSSSSSSQRSDSRGNGGGGCGGGSNGSSTGISVKSQSIRSREGVGKQEVLMLKVNKWNPERNREKRTYG